MGKGRIARRMLIGSTLWLGFTGRAMAQPLIDLPAFRDRVAAEVRRQQPEAKLILLGRVGLRVVLPGQPPKDQSLERAYELYRAEPQRLDELVQSYARSFQPIAITPASLRVLVRTDAANPPPEGPDGNRGLTRPIAGGLIAIVALDGPDAFEFPRAARLREGLKMDDAAIWSRALANTRAEIPFAPRRLKTGEPVGIESGKGLASSLLLDDAFWNAPTMTSQGPIAVALAGRDEIYLALASDGQVVTALRGELARNADSVLFPKLLVRRNSRWEVLP